MHGFYTLTLPFTLEHSNGVTYPHSEGERVDTNAVRCSVGSDPTLVCIGMFTVYEQVCSIN
jgi:hypothetical protein